VWRPLRYRCWQAMPASMPASASRHPGTAEEKMVTCWSATKIRQLHAAVTVSLLDLLVPADSALGE
jgi:hypothetical protein